MAVLLNLCNLRMNKESLEQTAIGRSLNKIYLIFHKSEVRMTLGFTVNFLAGVFLAMI